MRKRTFIILASGVVITTCAVVFLLPQFLMSQAIEKPVDMGTMVTQPVQAPDLNQKLENSIKEFAGHNGDYYAREFIKIQSHNGFVVSFNWMAMLLGPLWGAARKLWGFFWIFIILEMLAWVQIGRGIWGDLGADSIERYERLLNKAAERRAQAEAALAEGSDNAEGLNKIADNMLKAAEKARLAAEADNANAMLRHPLHV